jgi:hypothetical protein
MKNLYFEINPKEKKILSAPKELDINWKNISGIIFLSKDELYDLSWAGYTGSGFLKIDKENIDVIKNFNFDFDVLNITKSKFKDIVSNNRYEKELQPLLINNKFSIRLTEKFKLHLLMKYNECILNEDLKFNWKTLGGHIEFTSGEFLKLYQKVQNYIQNLFDLEIDLHKKIDHCESILSVIELDLDINCDNRIKL